MERYTEGWCQSADDTRIFFSVVGPGEGTTTPDLVLCDGLGCDGFVWKYLTPFFAKRHRVIRFHYRGHGRSDAPADLSRLGVPHLVDDLHSVLDHLDTEKAVLAGHSMGVQVILEAHRRAPERVAALVPICGSYGHPLDTFHDGPYLKRTFPFLYQIFTGFPEAVMRLWRTLLPSRLAYWVALFAGEVNRSLIRIEDLQPYFHHLARMDAEVFVRTLHHVSRHSAWDHLHRVDVPTLVIGGEEDTFTPAWLSHEMADAVPESELLVVPRGSHVAPLEQPELCNLRLEKFLDERVGAYRSKRRRASRNPGGARKTSGGKRAAASKKRRAPAGGSRRRAGGD